MSEHGEAPLAGSSRRRARHRILAGTLGVSMLLTAGAAAMRPPDPTEATWTAEQRAAATVSAATIQAPTGLGCTNGWQLFTGDYADISWTGTGPSTVKYEVWIRNASGSLSQLVAEPTGTTQRLSKGLLGGLLSGLLTLLTGGGTAYVDIVTVHSSGWRSVPSARIGIKDSSLLGTGLLGGLKCA